MRRDRRIATFAGLAYCAGCSGVGASLPDAAPTACPATCGESADGDCCESTLINGGTYFRDYDVATDGAWSDMSHPATISDFRFDKYEVTVGRFRAFVEAGEGVNESAPPSGAGAHDRIPGSGWDSSWNSFLPTRASGELVPGLRCDPNFATWTYERQDHEDLPMNCLSWYEAMAFCIWDGGYLPTSAEWNYAATGGSDQRAYPWSQPPGSLAIGCTNATFQDPALSCTAITAVGAKPAGDGRWGQADMAGNVDEWSLDWDSKASPPTYVEPCVDCAKLEQDAEYPLRVLRGSGFDDIPKYMRAGHGVGAQPAVVDSDFGVRCARPAAAARPPV